MTTALYAKEQLNANVIGFGGKITGELLILRHHWSFHQCWIQTIRRKQKLIAKLSTLKLSMLIKQMQTSLQNSFENGIAVNTTTKRWHDFNSHNESIHWYFYPLDELKLTLSTVWWTWPRQLVVKGSMLHECFQNLVILLLLPVWSVVNLVSFSRAYRW